MRYHPRTAVVALGGNALIVDATRQTIPDQYKAVSAAVPPIVDLIADGWRVVITHGNGPQVGFILRRSELAIAEVIPVPMDYATADTQGAIGYMFQKALHNELRDRSITCPVATVVTQVLVTSDDPAFGSPNKPIGAFMNEETAQTQAATLDWVVQEDAGRGWRRVVPSPIPQQIVELDAIHQLLKAGMVVVACGGGGIPVIPDEKGRLQGVEAVIDKDRTSSMLAREVSADLFLIATGVERVARDFHTKKPVWLNRLTIDEAKSLLAEGQFDPGSMQPKIEAMIDFVQWEGRDGIITDIQHLRDATTGKTGTHFIKNERP